jgi:hypothetical protein
MITNRKLFPALKIITLTSEIASRTPLCTCDYFKPLPLCTCDFKIRDFLKSCDCDPRCSCDSFNLEPPCSCDFFFEPPCDHCTCDSRKSICVSDFILPKVPLDCSLPKGCEVDGVVDRSLVRISSTIISKTEGTTTKVFYRDRSSAVLVECGEQES